MIKTCRNEIAVGDSTVLCGRPLVQVGVQQFVCRSCMARQLRRIPSERRAEASRINGRKGGRPRRQKVPA